MVPKKPSSGDDKYKNNDSYELELQTPHSVRSKIQAEGVLRKKRLEIGKILRPLFEWKKITTMEAEVCPNHVHTLLEIPSNMSCPAWWAS